MKDLNFSKLQETAKGKGRAKENGKEKQDGKIHKLTKDSNTKVKTTDSSNRDRKASSGHLDKDATKEKATRPSSVAKAEQITTARHIKFAQNEAELRSHSGKANAKTLVSFFSNLLVFLFHPHRFLHPLHIGTPRRLLLPSVPRPVHLYLQTT